MTAQTASSGEATIARLGETAQELLERARKQGADEAQVVAHHTTATQVRYEKNDFTCTSANTRSGCGLKVHVQQRKGTASTNETGPEALQDAAVRATTLAAFSLEDPYLCLPEKQTPAPLPGRYDEALAQLPAAPLHDLAATFLQVVAAEKTLSVDGGELGLQVSHQVIANSHGLRVSDRETRLDWTVMGMGKTASEVTSFDYLSDGAYAWDGAGAKAEATARKLVEKLLRSFGARPGESYKGRVLLAPGVLDALIFSPLFFHISGSQIMDGKSRWAESLGETIASQNFTLVDNPFNLDLAGATPYDAEGVAVSRTPLVEAGVLKKHIDSCYTANRRGTKTTGHAGGPHGIEMAPGGKSHEALRGMADQLVVVERFSGNADPITGDFSGVAKGSHYYKGGEYQHPLTETMIAGNFFDLLRNIVALSQPATPYCGQYVAPWALVDGISVTAG